MKKLITTIKNIFAIEDLRVRILNTLGFIAIFRLGSYVVLPGIDPTQLKKSTQGILGLLDTFLGGAFGHASIFALGIMPYISASIVLQLLTIAVPYFQKLQKEGESGRKKINQYTRVLTIAITLAQSVGFIATINADAIVVNNTLFTISSMLILTAGTMFCMWLGEKITDKGIGNGISMLIMIGIVSRLPGALVGEMLAKGLGGALIFILELIVLFFVVMGVVMLTQAIRRIPVQYAKQVGGSASLQAGQRQFIPLKVNAAGVMPIIFAQSLMFLPAMLANLWRDKSDFANEVGIVFSDYTSWQYNLSFAVLIIIFTFFYTAISVNPNQISDDLKRSGGFVPGVKPGLATSEFIDVVLTRITFPGALFLAIIAILPSIAMLFGITREFAAFFGGTSLIILVGVVLDTLNQVESYLLMRHYDGMMKSGKLRGRTKNIAVAS